MFSSLLGMASCALFVAVLLAASASDFRYRRISNRLVLLLMLGAPLFHLTTGSGLASLAASTVPAMAILAGGLVLFQCRWLGAGDVKLAAAVSLWLSPEDTALFLIATALFGALSALLLLLWQCWVVLPADGRHALAAKAQPLVVPYGVAISAGALLSFAAGPLDWL